LVFDRRGRLVGGFGGGFITVDDPAAAAPTVQLLHGVGVPSSIALAADGDRLLVVGSGGAVLLSLRGDGPTSRVLDGTGLGEVTVSDDGRYVTVSDASTFDARLWHLTDSGAEPVELGELHPFFMWIGPGGRVAAIDRRRGVALLEVSTGRSLVTLEGWSGADGAYPMFSADGRLLAVSTQAGEVAVFATDTGRRRWTFADLAGASNGSTDAPLLAFDPGATQLTGVWPGRPAVRWDLSTGAPTVLGDLGADLTAFTIGPAGELVSGHSSGQVVVRDPTTLQPTGTTFDATRGGYASVTYSADGRRLLTAFSGESRLWDAVSHQPIGDALPSDENSVLYPSTSLTYAVTVRDRRLVRWSIDDRQWPAIACAVAGRDLTPSEWAQYGPRDTAYHSTCSPPS
jgi:WD40 repeat protein